MEDATREFLDMAVERAEARAVPPPPRPPELPERDDAPEIETPEETLGHAEGQSFMIEYRDGRGRRSDRRITVFALARGIGGMPVLRAHCHERDATRFFRIDRIACCIDYDGEVHDDVAAFLGDAFGMTAARAALLRPTSAHWTQVRVAVAPHLNILAALSHCDGLMCDPEVDVAADHGCEIADRCGLRCADDTGERLASYVRRLRPNEASLRKAVVAMIEETPEVQRHFLLACVALIDADGHRHPEEVALVDRLAEDLIGARLF